MAYAPINSSPPHLATVWKGSFAAQQRSTVAQAGNDKPSGEHPNEDDEARKPVITPGGPRPREQVHPVGPGEMLRRNPDGTYSVVPKPGAGDNDDTKPKK